MTFIKGVVSNPLGRKKGTSGTNIERINSKLGVRYKEHFPVMLEKQIEKAESGSLPAFIYLTDRVLGRPVESFKIAQVVRLVMGKED